MAYLSVDKIARIVSAMPPRRKALFAICLAIFVGSITALLWQVNQTWLVSVPMSGGQYNEGVLGTPRFINPLLATSPVDRDLTTLIYSGLLRRTSNGELIPDLAESYIVSPDGLTYTFTLKSGLVWHDGEPVTIDDVIFTLAKAKDPGLKSPRRANWEGVEIEKVDNQHLIFSLKQPYTLFLDNLTIGILPAHRWQRITTEVFPFTDLNREPIGTGPYQIAVIKRDRDNLPITYTLTPFKHFVLGEPKISKIIIRFYGSEEALLSAYNQGEIEAMNAINPAVVRTLEMAGAKVITTTLPRVFGIFFNQNQQKLFTRSEIRAALTAAINREAIINEVLRGYGQALTSPLPPPFAPQELATKIDPVEILKQAGWQKNATTSNWELPAKKKGDSSLTLHFTLTTSDTPELKQVAELVKRDWETIGIRVDLKIFEWGALNQTVIRPRDYDALLFGEIVGRESDLYSFWHSNQRLDPGLNIALYANVAVDKILEEIKVASTTEERARGYLAFDAEIRQDQPAIFLYAPDFLYVIPPSVQAINLGVINTPAERFLNVYQWYIKTDRVWPVFANN